MKANQFSVRTALQNKRGMTLTEMLVALAILVTAIMTFLPLAQSTFRNVHGAGQKTKSNYQAVGLIEKLIGNSGANGDYEVSTENIPLQMHAKGKAIQAKTNGLQSIDGATILSKPENPTTGFSAFICDSVTAKMVCYPTHIADDFLTKTITLYASGFRFSSVAEFEIYNTDENGIQQLIPGLYNENNPYCRLKIDKSDTSIVHMTLVGDNDVIRFEHSPLIIKYRVYELKVEIDAPTVIMVGEEAADGNYYYYATSGEPDENGNLEIVRKRMNSRDPLGRISGEITLNSAMNDVEWVEAGEGDDGNGGVNDYGYYVMCGDNGQMRRFWRNPKTGNYGWGGDFTQAYDYYYSNYDGGTGGIRKEENKRIYDTTAQYSYAYLKDPTKHGVQDHNTQSGATYQEVAKFKEDDSRDEGINLVPRLDSGVQATIFNSLYTQTLFSVNALEKYDIDVYTAGDLLWVHRRTDLHKTNAWDEVKGIANKYMNVNNTSDSWIHTFQYGNTNVWNNTLLGGNPLLRSYTFNHNNATVKQRANDMIDYKEYNNLDPDTDNYITLTSVDAIRMNNLYTSDRHPTQSYTLYCGYIPAVMDIWATNLGVEAQSDYNFGEWRSTLGVAFEDNEKEIVQVNATKYFIKAGAILRGHIYSSLKNWYIDLDAYAWRYGDARPSNYALSGVCGPSNYAPGTIQALEDSLRMASSADGFGGRMLYPLHTNEHQTQLQQQNTTAITISYLSHPYAKSGAPDWHNVYDQSPGRHSAVSGAFEWALNESLTFMDVDSITYEDYEGNGGSFSIAVGYYVGGLVHEQQSNKMITAPTVMNIGAVYMRAGGDNDEGFKKGHELTDESNVFNEFYNTNDYWRASHRPDSLAEKTFDRSVSAGYWRDAYHPQFLSTNGGAYDRTDDSEKSSPGQYNYLMGHILQNKKLTTVSWGMTWNESPEAMWGASDGTLMSWFLDLDARSQGNASANNDESITCEFQSYKQLQSAIEYGDKWPRNDGHDLNFYWNAIGTGIGHWEYYKLPKTADEATRFLTENGNPDDENAYWDKCSAQLGKTDTLGMMSPLDTVDDVAYADDIWVACGVQGLADPRFDKSGHRYCRDGAVVKKRSDVGSWICVRSWYDQSNGQDRGPTKENSNYIWQVVQISEIQNCNIRQVTYCNGMWYAVGYIDTNDNGKQDYGGSLSAKEREHAVVFYAIDPTKPCGDDKGWKLSDNGNKGYTQAYANDGSGNYKMLDIDGINAVASRNS